MHLLIIGGSDAGISAALRARELDPGAEIAIALADDYPNFSICGLPTISVARRPIGMTSPIAPNSRGSTSCGDTQRKRSTF